MEIKRSALKHGVAEDDIRHGMATFINTFVLEPDEDPPTMLTVGWDRNSVPLELIWVTGDDGEPRVFHAMKLRKTFHYLLPREDQ